MAEKRTNPGKAGSTPAAPQITPMPFPGESPTVSLAMAAGQMYGFHPEEKPAKAKPKRARATSARARSKKAAGKSAPPARSSRKPRRKAA